MAAASKPQVIRPGTIEIKNILFTTDFSAVSQRALHYAHAIALRYGSKIYLLHALPPEPQLAVPMDKFPSEMDVSRQASVEHMTKLLNEEPLSDVVHDVLIERGSIPELVPATIQQFDVDLVICGTHGHGGLKKMVLGSVAEEIFRTAACPVITVGPTVGREELDRPDFNHILFATDFSPGSLHALPWALSLGSHAPARLTMLHVVHEISDAAIPYLDEVAAACKQRLTELLPQGITSQPHFFVEFGSVADTILKVAEEEQADLIVMGARRTALPVAVAHLPWPSAYRVACHAHCPVLTVRS